MERSAKRKAQSAEGREHGAGSTEPKAKNNSKSAIRNPQFPLKIAFLGRLDPIKGPDILIRALRSIPNAAVELHLYGIVQGQAETVYLDELKNLGGGGLAYHFLTAGIESSSDRIVARL